MVQCGAKSTDKPIRVSKSKADKMCGAPNNRVIEDRTGPRNKIF
jgi:hypothetical protein